MAGHILTPALPGSTIVVLDYASPVILLVYFFGVSVFAWCRPHHNTSKAISRRRRICLVALSSTIALSYAAQYSQYLPQLSATPDHCLVHPIALFLFWITLSLVLPESNSPLPVPYIGVSGLNVVLEIILCILSNNDDDVGVSYSFPKSRNALKIITILLLGMFATLAALFLGDSSSENADDETQPLIRKQSGHDLAANDGPNYTALDSTGRFTPTQIDPDDETSSQCDVNSDADSDNEKDDEEIRLIQQQRLESSGGWIGYLKAFTVFVPYVVPTKSLKLQAYVLLLLVNIIAQRFLNVLIPRQLGIVIDKFSNSKNIPWYDIAIWISLGIINSGNVGIGAVNEMLENRLIVWSRQELAYASLNQVMNLDMSFHDQKDSGEVIKAVEQASSLNNLLRVMVVEIIPAIMDTFVALGFVTYLFDVYASLILIATAIAFVFATYHLTLVLTVSRRISSHMEREKSKLIYESVGNWFTISCFNRKRHTMARLSHVLERSRIASLWNDDLFTYIWAAQESAEHCGRIAITILAAYRIMKGTSTVGNFVTLETYWDTMTWPLYKVGLSYRRLTTNLIDAERLLQLFQKSPSVKDSTAAQPIGIVTGRVDFNDVHFSYENREPTLRGFNMTAKPGQTVALVGETGSGKSTLIKVLMRFYDVTGGSITIDDHDLRDVTLDSLREIFGFVPQDPVLFNMSILENVRYGRLNATDEEIYTACRAASIHDKILSFPSGYASKVGERGIQLSGGERQRVAIARAFLKNAPIILLDEATSAMDSQTESKIQDALKELTKGRTTFVIAHRLSTVVEADAIFVVDKGQVFESGTHDDLMSKKGRYFGLWTKQTTLPVSGSLPS